MWKVTSVPWRGRAVSRLISKRLNLSSEEIENSLRNAAGSLHQSWMKFIAFQAKKSKKPLAVSAIHPPHASQTSFKCCLELLWVARFLWKVSPYFLAFIYPVEIGMEKNHG